MRVEPDELPPGRDWRLTVAVVWLSILIAIMGMSLVIPFLPLYLRDLGVPENRTRLWAGWVGGANFLCAGLVAPLWGSMADRYGRKAMTLRALFGLAVSVLLMGVARDVYQLFALRMLQGMFGGFVAAAIALVGSAVPREHVGASLGILQTATVAGHLVGPLLGGELSSLVGYRSTFQITGAALLSAALLVLLMVREPPMPADAATRRVPVGEAIREFWRIPVVRHCIIAVLLCQCALMLVNPQLALFLKQILDDGPNLNRAVGWVIAAPALSSLLAAALWGRLGDRRGHALAWSFALTGAAFVSFPTALVAGVWSLFFARFCLGFFTAAFNPLSHSAVAHAVPQERTAGAFSMLSSAQMLGACIGPFASGPLATVMGIRPLFPAAGVCLLFAALAARRAAAGREVQG